MELTKNELQLMTVFWHSGTPMARSEILRKSTGRVWKGSSLHTMLNRLIKKGAILEHGFIKDGKVISRTFAHALSREEYYKFVFAEYDFAELEMLFSEILRDKSDKEDSAE